MKMKERVLVVGANGFVGFNLVNELISNKIPVTALIKNNSLTTNLKKIGCYNIIQTNNLNDVSIIRQLLVSKPKYVVNCIWNKKNNDVLSSLDNTKILIELLELTKKINSDGFINLGTYEEYGLFKEDISENQVCYPKTEFGKLKNCHSIIVSELAKSLNIKACHLRISELYSLKEPESFLFKTLIKNIANQTAHTFSYTNNKVDYIFVSDLCRAIIQLINNNSSGIFNVSSGQAFYNRDLINMINQQFKSKVKLEEIENKKSFSLNINRVFELTGWKPTISIWDGITMLLQEEKFKNPNTFENFTKTIRTLYR